MDEIDGRDVTAPTMRCILGAAHYYTHHDGTRTFMKIERTDHWQLTRTCSMRVDVTAQATDNTCTWRPNGVVTVPHDDSCTNVACGFGVHRVCGVEAETPLLQQLFEGTSFVQIKTFTDSSCSQWRSSFTFSLLTYFFCFNDESNRMSYQADIHPFDGRVLVKQHDGLYCQSQHPELLVATVADRAEQTCVNGRQISVNIPNMYQIRTTYSDAGCKNVATMAYSLSTADCQPSRSCAADNSRTQCYYQGPADDLTSTAYALTGPRVHVKIFKDNDCTQWEQAMGAPLSFECASFNQLDMSFQLVKNGTDLVVHEFKGSKCNDDAFEQVHYLDSRVPALACRKKHEVYATATPGTGEDWRLSFFSSMPEPKPPIESLLPKPNEATQSMIPTSAMSAPVPTADSPSPTLVSPSPFRATIPTSSQPGDSPTPTERQPSMADSNATASEVSSLPAVAAPHPTPNPTPSSPTTTTPSLSSAPRSSPPLSILPTLNPAPTSSDPTSIPPTLTPTASSPSPTITPRSTPPLDAPTPTQTISTPPSTTSPVPSPQTKPRTPTWDTTNPPPMTTSASTPLVTEDPISQNPRTIAVVATIDNRATTGSPSPPSASSAISILTEDPSVQSPAPNSNTVATPISSGPRPRTSSHGSPMPATPEDPPVQSPAPSSIMVANPSSAGQRTSLQGSSFTATPIPEDPRVQSLAPNSTTVANPTSSPEGSSLPTTTTPAFPRSITPQPTPSARLSKQGPIREETQSPSPRHIGDSSSNGQNATVLHADVSSHHLLSILGSCALLLSWQRTRVLALISWYHADVGSSYHSM